MRIFREFDYFRKSTSPEKIQPTLIGGFISIACFFVSSSSLASL